MGRFFGRSLGLVLAAALVSPACWAQAVVMVTGVQGRVTDARDAEVEVLRELETGTRLTLADGARLMVVHLISGAEYDLTGPAVLEIGAEAMKLDGQAIEGRVLLASVAAQNTSGYAQAAVVMRAPQADAQAIRMRYPVESRIVETRPEFTWEPLGPGFDYRFELLDQQGASLFLTETAQTLVVLPDTIELPRGELLTWELEARRGAQLEYASAEFMVASRDEFARLEAGSPGVDASRATRIAHARLLEQLGYRHAAEAAWQGLGIER
jgi:hypothetical protein